MAFHKKFTFEDPEDSYWNQSVARPSIFDDVGAKQAEARAALSSLFDPLTASSQLSPVVPAAGVRGEEFLGMDGVLVTIKNLVRGVRGGNIRSEEVGKSNHSSTDVASSSPEAAESTRNVAAQKLTQNFNKQASLSPKRFSQGLSVNTKQHMSTASLVSECSASSLPSDANKLDLDYNRLKQEHRRLQKHLDTMRHGRFRPIDVKETTRRLLFGESASLDLYKSKEEKQSLLDAACDVIDRNVILTVVLYLKSSLCDSLFRELLLTHGEAVEAYIDYLKEIKDVDELTTALFALGRNGEAAMVELSAASRMRSVPSRIVALKRCLANSFLDPQLSTEAALLEDHINLLERQILIEEADEKLTKSHPIMTAYPRHAKLAGQSAIATLYYSCLYHYDLPPANPSNPQSICQLIRLSEKEFVWIAVSALVRQSRWPDVERALQSKGSFTKSFHTRGLLSVGGMNKLSCPFSWQNLMRVLHSNGTLPPKDFLCRVLRSVGDEKERLRLAQKANVPEIVIESLVNTREKEKLASYAATLTPNSSDAFKALAALNNTTIKWKT